MNEGVAFLPKFEKHFLVILSVYENELNSEEKKINSQIWESKKGEVFTFLM